MAGSGEHRLELADTDRCPADFDEERDRDTWPRIPAAPPAARLDLETDIFTGELEDP